MKEALVVPAVPAGEPVAGGPYRAERNPNYRSHSARTNRPVVDFARCTRCSLCWLQCPDGAFNITPDGFYDIDFEYCNGCGICVAVCPVKGCMTMVPELQSLSPFDNGESRGISELSPFDKGGLRGI
ncbi:MAG: 4Fe-4S binding protein [Chloroflexi bacterium]|nr:4Fe-4S binding protein [Chloroflexota bacterium]